MAGSVDPVAGAAQILSVFVGAATAAALAPHLIVLISGMAGGVLGLMSWRKCNAIEGTAYVLFAGLTAWLFAGQAAEFVAHHWAAISDKRMVSPAALAIGWIGHRWPSIGKWLGGMVKASAEAAIKTGGKK